MTDPETVLNRRSLLWCPVSERVSCPACRAVQYAIKKNVTVVAAAGNDDINLDNPKFDSMSPNNGTADSVQILRLASVLTTLSCHKAAHTKLGTLLTTWRILN